MIDYAAARFAEEITAWPDGVYEGDAYVDHDPLGNPDIHLHVKITVDGPKLTIDYTGSDERQELQAWSTYGNTRGYTVAQVAAMMDPEIPKNEGFFNSIELIVPEGCVLNPRPGRPVSAGTHHPGADIGEVIAVALSGVLPERAVPQTYKTGIPTTIRGVTPAAAGVRRRLGRGVRRLVQRRQGQDAWGAVSASFGNLWKATAEINESLYPHIQWSRDYRTDSGGAGAVAWRVRLPLHEGGAGPARGLHLRGGAEVPDAGDRRRWARGAQPADAAVRVASALVVEHTAEWVPMEAGDKINFDYGGGGGWGDPLERPAAAVLDDVLDEYVSVEGARRDYGVVLVGSLEELTLEVDVVATEARRAEMRAERGPG